MTVRYLYQPLDIGERVILGIIAVIVVAFIIAGSLG